MEQSELYALEAMCIQEEPPHCRAACPLHLDVREFCKHLATRNMRKAWTLLCKSLPLPTLLSRICDQPCGKACIRQELGGVVQVASLERACAELSGKATPPPALPKRGRKVSVFGHDLAALSAASEMMRKGIEVELFCSGSIHELLHGLKLPKIYSNLESLTKFLDDDMAILAKAGLVLHENTCLHQELVDSEIERAGVVFVGPSAYEALCEGMPEPDTMTLGTVMTGVFASCWPEGGEDDNGVSPVALAALGRRAAVSIDRYHQKASLTIGREREGIFASKLFTSLEGVESVDVVRAEGASYTETEMRAEAKRCLRCECMHCVNHCEYLKSFGSYPKQYTRRIYNNEAVVMGTRLSNKLINSCMTCGLCSTICPEHFDMGQLCLTTRQSMVRKGIMPPSAHEFALRDMAFANGEACALTRHEPEHETSSWLFFPGCQLSASSPSNVENAWEWLRKTLPILEKDKSGVGIMLHCCGAPAHWAGREELFHENLRKIAAAWESLAKPTVVTACPSCARMFHEYLPEIPVQSFWQYMEKALNLLGPDTLQNKQHTAIIEAVALHDPCGTREDDEVRTAVRTILQSLGIKAEEPALSGRTTECCGFGGLSAEANPELGKVIIKGRAERLSKAASQGITYCAMCRDRLAGADMPTAHLLDILFDMKGINDRCCGQGDEESISPSIFSRKAPTYSERRENRVALRDHLLTTMWAEAPGDRPAWSSVKVRYTEAATKAMHERRIMDSDVKKVLHYVEESGRWLLNTQNDEEKNHRLAAFRPTIVTYWVQFTPDPECPDERNAWLVHNTWCHRMHILNRKKG